MRVQLKPHNSVYEKAVTDRKIAAQILLPLIEFEFAFWGCQKPAIMQSSGNLEQLKMLFRICKSHGWLSTKEITEVSSKNGYWFKISNSGFSEVYNIAGPLADKRKNEWAILLCERANNSDSKERGMGEKILCHLSKGKMTTAELCLASRKLPYTITRHLKKLQKDTRVSKDEKFWFIPSDGPGNSPT